MTDLKVRAGRLGSVAWMWKASCTYASVLVTADTGSFGTFARIFVEIVA